MVSIKELRKICQAREDRHNPTSLIEERIPRIFSIYITKLLTLTSVKADHVTMLMVFWGIIPAFFFSTGDYWYMLIGSIFLWFIPLLDCIDGELARYKKTSSLNGEFLDPIAHVTHTAVPFIGLTIGLYKLNPSVYTIFIGLLASVFSVLYLTVQPIKYYIIVKNLIRNSKNKGFKKVNKETIKEITKDSKLKSLAKSINYLYHSFYIIYLLLFAAILNKLYWVLFFYGLTFPLVWLIKLIHEYKVGYEPYEYLFDSYKK
jgi:hypothetical protein